VQLIGPHVETPPVARSERYGPDEFDAVTVGHDAGVSDDRLERARAGDEQAFRELVEPFQHELRVHCYRVLGSLTDAEDLLQETLIAAWRGLDGFEGRASLRAWLYRIATNRCLNARRDAGRRPTEPVPPFDPPEPTRRSDVTWLQPFPDTLLEQALDREPGPEVRYTSREAIELTFVATLQHLPPRQTAALVLRDVLGYSTAEVAAMLETSTTAVKGALQRARAGLRHHRGDIAGHRVPLPASPEERTVAERFAETFTAGDVDGLVALLTDDAWLAMPPAPHQYQGREAIAAFLSGFTTWRAGRSFRLLPTRANTRPAFGCYLTEPDGPTAHPAGILVLTPQDTRLRAVTWFLDDALFGPFQLPARVEGCTSGTFVQ
jgi:RNA polymerase sigma-70 factor (ECF subfamily)